LKNLDKDIYISAIRDMTKIHEAVYSGLIEDVINQLETEDLRENPYGEWVVVISKKI
jgi:16S rRNA C1402 (ribose-2'-O) methylase RsmI